ncbi:hypothetical protein RchiOBHm_Chr6g0260091 [Rosa chinensis]|uniref:Secreted protein n=1 Tax=Rosa chinensis TaxID=74649 RepID=A0A2P6PN08_ROSCH|nr:hypothetical protein RchiOBHm_Chr6g0260091 [Rosa chinensis]
MHCKVLSRRFWIFGSSLAWCITSQVSGQFSALPEAVWKCQHGFCIVHLHNNAISLILYSSCLRETMILPLQ